jgi:hypothetical protein
MLWCCCVSCYWEFQYLRKKVILKICLEIVGMYENFQNFFVILLGTQKCFFETVFFQIFKCIRDDSDPLAGIKLHGIVKPLLNFRLVGGYKKFDEYSEKIIYHIWDSLRGWGQCWSFVSLCSRYYNTNRVCQCQALQHMYAYIQQIKVASAL